MNAPILLMMQQQRNLESQSTTTSRKACLPTPTACLVVPLLAFASSESRAVGHHYHVYGSRAWCAAVMEGSMMILEKEHAVAWLWLSGAGAGDEKLVYSAAPPQW